MPFPSAFVVKNGSKIFGRTSGAIPTPRYDQEGPSACDFSDRLIKILRGNVGNIAAFTDPIGRLQYLPPGMRAILQPVSRRRGRPTSENGMDRPRFRLQPEQTGRTERLPGHEKRLFVMCITSQAQRTR